MLVSWDDATRGALAVTNTVKPSAAAAVAGLRGLGLRPVLLTGDNAVTAQADCIGTSLPYAWQVISGLIGDLGETTQRRGSRPWPGL